ncbi:hypothetical protein RLOC_00005462 [Lonchura striata]|uniref:Uncharacterized protein n=1 Tax=Lonchura striata TaxID=40157 RepID=A0A218V7F5_9PASE|nr:hypothetical protein RLOC_00005462 [Lonchura striata domestica]
MGSLLDRDLPHKAAFYCVQNANSHWTQLIQSDLWTAFGSTVLT